MNVHCISLAVAILAFFGTEFCVLVYKVQQFEQLIEQKKKTAIGHYLLE